ncbi:hypothetical protein [Staphylococcus sp. Marseille-Q6910]|uniref:hypothetical protein n=1 Tax=Staphylococcus sp. Marseille-Q6910 TaxID=2937990 RepID=UPI00203D4C2E|nr:hypothetical protein [Staphylococcus sp. Marseille-Q6910]
MDFNKLSKMDQFKSEMEKNYKNQGRDQIVNEYKQTFTSLKIDKDYKLLFDELAFNNRKKKLEFIEDLLEFWGEHNDKAIFEKFKDGKL